MTIREVEFMNTNVYLPCNYCDFQCTESGCALYKKYKDDDEKFLATVKDIQQEKLLGWQDKVIEPRPEPPYQDALDLWGVDSQFGMMSEETAELIEQAATLILTVAKYQKALNQYRRGRISLEELIEELVDTDIMIEEMKVVLQNLNPGIDIQQMCKQMWDKKILKFQLQVNEAKEKRG